MRLRLPRIFSMGVTFPRDQVLSSARGSPVGVDGFHLIFLFSINELARLRNEVGTELRNFLVRREKQSVEDAMHLPSRREVEVVGVWGDT